MAIDAEFEDQLNKDRAMVSNITSQFYRDTKLSWRVKTILDYNPYMASNMNAVIQMAQMSVSDNELFSNSGAMYGVQAADTLAQQLQRYTPSVQRSIFATLTPGQQQTLRQMGFEPAKADIDEGNAFEQFLGDVVGGLGSAAKFVTRGIGKTVMPVLGPALNLMDEASDFVVGRPYRTIRQLEGEAQIAGLIGGLAAAAGALFAIPTGGASLALVGLAGVAGAAAGSLGQQAVTSNADDWFNAWSRAGNGERLFANGGVRKATEILGDPRLVNMAQKIALELDDRTSLIEIAQDVAGVEGSLDQNRQNEQIAKIATELAQPGTPQYQAVYSGLSDLIANPLFQEAVKTLEQSKISLGRDVAGAFFDEDSDAYRWISGAVDAASILIIDPFLVAGKVARVANMGRRGLMSFEAGNAAQRFRSVAERPEVARVFEVVAEAINTGSTRLLDRYTPWMKPVWNELLTHARNPEIAAKGPLTGEDVVDWIVGSNQMKSMMQGVGLVQGSSYGTLRGLNKTQYAFRTAKGALYDFMQGAADTQLEKVLPRLAKNPDALKQLLSKLPDEWDWAVHLMDVSDEDLASQIANLVRENAGLGTRAYQAGRAASRIPGLKTFGTFYENISTLVPRGTIIAIDPLKAESVSDIDAFIDLFKTVGVPSYVREIWKRAIYESPQVGTRINLLSTMIDSAATATGIRSTRVGSEMLDKVLNRFKQEYALGSAGRFDLGDLQDLPVAALPEADAAQLMQIPDLKTMRQAVRQGTFMRVLMGVSDNVAIEAFQNKFWKPAVLLRFGFLVRNVTEDMLSFLTRTGFGHLSQEFAARSVGRGNVYQAALRTVSPGVIQDGKRLGVQLRSEVKGALNNVLDPAERLALRNRYEIPAHLRPVARIIEKFGTTGSPALVHMANYGAWLRGKLESGSKIYQTLTSLIPDASKAPAEGLLRNFYQNLDFLAYGSENSIRRLLKGGVNPDLVRAAERFQAKHFGSIMERVGATSTLPWQNLLNGDEIVVRTISEANGTPQYVRVKITGERTFTNANVNSANVEDFHEAVLNSVTRLTDDGPASRMLLEVLKTYTDDIRQIVPEQQLYQLFDLWGKTGRRMFGGDEEDVLRLGMLLLEARQSPERYRAFIDNLEAIGAKDSSGVIEDIFKSELKSRYGGPSVPTPKELTEIWRELMSNARREQNFARMQQLSQFEPTMNFIAAMDEVTDPATRKWLHANFSHDAASRGNHFTHGTDLSFNDMMNNWRRTMKDPAFEQSVMPFHQDLESALRKGREFLVEEINQGKWDYVFSLGRDYVPGTKGTQFHLVRTSKALEGKISDDILRDMKLVLSDGTVDVASLAQVLQVDIANLSQNEIAEFVKFANNFVDSLRTGQPFIVGSKAVADQLQKINGVMHGRHFNIVAPPTRLSWLPVTDNVDLLSAYPELAQRTAAIKSGLDENALVSTISWDANIYPTPDSYIEGATKLTYPERTVQRLEETIRQRVRGGRRVKMVVRDNAEIYMRLNGVPIRVPPGTVIDEGLDLFADTQFEKLVGVNNKQYFRPTDVTYVGNENIMWGILGPVMTDLAEEIGGAPIRAVKSFKTVRASKLMAEAGGTVPGQLVQIPEDVIRVRSSDVRDVLETPGEILPDWEIAQAYEPISNKAWDRFVQFGFEKVMSPVIDAIARRPMAFNSFVNAYNRNVASVSWLFRGTEEESEINTIISRLVNEDQFRGVPETFMPRFVESGRLVAEVHGIKELQYWNDGQILAYLRSLSGEEIENLSTQVAHAFKNGKVSATRQKANALVNFLQKNHSQLTGRFFESELTAWNFLDRIDAMFGEGAAVSGKILDPDIKAALTIQRIREATGESWENVSWRLKLLDPRWINDPFNYASLEYAKALTKDDWKSLQKASAARQRAFDNAEEYAVEYAIRDIMPFIDTHEVRSQFADWARGYLPFWYAEENFLKRWARIFSLEGPAGGLARARKLQLTANGLRTMGVVREDPNGNSYFVYPGSELLAETIEKIPGLEMLPVTALLQSPTDRMIPGFNPQFGTPGFSPLVALPVEFSTWLFPESSAVRNFQRTILGDISVNQDVLNILFPAQVVNTVKAVYEFTKPYDSQGNERIQSAMVAAMAHLEAAGNGLPDDATPAQVDDFLRRVRNHARIISLSQAIAGWFTPAPAMSLQLPEGENSLSFLTEGQINNPAEVFSSTYFELIKNLGIEEGTQAYLERFPDGTVNDVLQPMAYTVSKTESVSGAPLPRSEEGIFFYEQSKSVLDQYKFAGPWLLPQDAIEKGEESQYAYDAAVIEGLRKTKSPDEFIREMKFREGSTIYFKARKEYLDQYAILEQQKNSAAMKTLRARWDGFAQMWKATHPIFADILVNSDARERRQNIIEEMRYLLNDPNAPKASHFDQLKVLMESYDTFNVERSRLNLSRTASSRARVEILKKRFEDWVGQYTLTNPMVNSFWLTVLRPESGLD